MKLLQQMPSWILHYHLKAEKQQSALKRQKNFYLLKGFLTASKQNVGVNFKKNQRFCQKNEAPATDTILDPLFPFKGWKTTKCLVEANVKNRSQFDPPVMFFDINYLYWT